MSRVPGKPEGLAQIVQQIHEPHTARRGVDTELIVALGTDVSVNVDDEVAAGASDLDGFVLGADVGSFGFTDFEELHSRDFVGSEHCRRETQGRLDEIASGHAGLLGINVHLLGDFRTHAPGKEQ
jgi:hypothetical protein